MAQSSELNQIAERRRLLIRQSDELRRQLVSDCAALQSAVAWVESGRSLLQSTRPFWPLLAGFAGLLLARRGRSWWGKAARLFGWWRMARKVRAVWGSFATFGT